MCLYTYEWNLLHCVFFITVNCLLLFKRPLGCSQISWGDLSKCCRVLQLWECHLINRAHRVTSWCVLEEAWLSVCSLNSIEFELLSVLLRFCISSFSICFFSSHASPVAWVGSAKTNSERLYPRRILLYAFFFNDFFMKLQPVITKKKPLFALCKFLNGRVDTRLSCWLRKYFL